MERTDVSSYSSPKIIKLYILWIIKPQLINSFKNSNIFYEYFQAYFNKVTF